MKEVLRIRAYLSNSLNLPSTIAGTCPIGFTSEEKNTAIRTLAGERRFMN
jgi:hypothetical protein